MTIEKFTCSVCGRTLKRVVPDDSKHIKRSDMCRKCYRKTVTIPNKQRKKKERAARKKRSKKKYVDDVRQCIVCGIQYVPRSINQKYCSPECRNKSNAKRYRGEKPKNMNELIQYIRKEFAYLKVVSPEEANNVVEDMKEEEGIDFVKMVLGDLIC